MANAIRVHKPGGADTLVYGSYEPGQPGAGEVRLQQHAVSLNFIDVYHRTDLYPMDTPFIPGLEAPAVASEIDLEVNGVAVGDRVACAGMPIGHIATRAQFPPTDWLSCRSRFHWKQEPQGYPRA